MSQASMQPRLTKKDSSRSKNEGWQKTAGTKAMYWLRETSAFWGKTRTALQVGEKSERNRHERNLQSKKKGAGEGGLSKRKRTGFGKGLSQEITKRTYA